MKLKLIFLSFFTSSILTTQFVLAAAYPYAPQENVIGCTTTYQVAPGESLLEVARKFGLGFNQIIEANPGLDPFFPGTITVTVPGSWIVPDPPGKGGIMINISEMRLYYFLSNNEVHEVMTYPIGIGSEGTDTPMGCFRIIQKMVNPTWRVPASIRKENPALPKEIPPGDDNPLGSHALRLSLGDVLIHSTNRPWGIGRKATHGCIRLYPEDMPTLFGLASVGTTVTIVRQPVKVGKSKGNVYIEVHKDDFLKGFDYGREARLLLNKKALLGKVDKQKLKQALKTKQGFPVDISRNIP